jgi:hypothetical protein
LPSGRPSGSRSSLRRSRSRSRRGLAVARPAVAHLLGEVAHALLQVVERPALRARGLARVAAPQRILGVAHRALGAAERLGHRHAVLVEPVHEFAELAAQAFLLAALLLAPLAIARLALTLLPLLALLALLPLLTLLATLSCWLATCCWQPPHSDSPKLVLAARQAVEQFIISRPCWLPLALLAALPCWRCWQARPSSAWRFPSSCAALRAGAASLALAVLRHLADLVEHLLQVVAGDGVVGSIFSACSIMRRRSSGSCALGSSFCQRAIAS